MVYLLVFLSGAAALTYEIVWGRQLATFLGITTYAHTIVLASFMAGLGIGSLTIGRLADRWRDPLRLFACLEAGIGLFGLATLALVPVLQTAYVAIAPDAPTGWGANAARLLMAGLAVLPPTVLMGGTLPALVKSLRLASESLSRTVSALYFFNTLGAAAGALACGYLLLPRLGAHGSIAVAAGINLLVAIIVLTAGTRKLIVPRAGSLSGAREVELAVRDRRLLIIGFALSGAAALALQIAWIRALTQIIGSSVYAFGLTTASYLVGLALGSLVAALIANRLAERGATIRSAALFEAGVGLTVIAGIPILERL
ncbi:MAG: fused MFS/spermidine synthase, partial [Acidobacteriota bacterium]|nr:fused MFS/spermidine synthase [Acidobacteriota bacterium]